METGPDPRRQYGLEDKVIFRGMVRPEDLPPITRSAYIGHHPIRPAGYQQTIIPSPSFLRLYPRRHSATGR